MWRYLMISVHQLIFSVHWLHKAYDPWKFFFSGHNFFLVYVVYSFQNEPGKSFVDVISVEHSEKDKYTDLCERKLL